MWSEDKLINAPTIKNDNIDKILSEVFNEIKEYGMTVENTYLTGSISLYFQGLLKQRKIKDIDICIFDKELFDNICEDIKLSNEEANEASFIQRDNYIAFRANNGVMIDIFFDETQYSKNEVKIIHGYSVMSGEYIIKYKKIMLHNLLELVLEENFNDNMFYSRLKKHNSDIQYIKSILSEKSYPF